jgi:monoamine oxidase
MNDLPSYVVIGAGLAGLSVAAELTRRGASVTILEARERVGGRILSRSLSTPDSGEDLIVDLGAQWIGPDQTRMLKLIKDLGLHAVKEGVPGRTSWSVAGRLRLGGSFLPKVGTRTFTEMLAAVAAIRLEYPRLPPDSPWSAKTAQRWDAITTEDWLHRLVHTPEGKALIEIYVRGNTATEPSETSFYEILAGIRGCGSLGNIWRAEAFRVSEGAFEIPVRLSAPLQERIRFGSAVRAISQDEEGVTVEDDTEVFRARRAVVCIPPVLIDEITFSPSLPAAKATLFSSARMGACIKFHAVYDRPFWRAANLNGTILSADDAVCLTYDNSPRTGTAGAIVGFVLADQARRLSSMTLSEQENEILSCLGRFLGGSARQPEAFVVQDWSKEEWTRGAFAAHYPIGLLTQVGSALQSPYGRVHWAGTDTSPEWWGYMEGAVRSATRVVAELATRADWGCQ